MSANEYRVQVGDLVRVDVHSAQTTITPRAEVLHLPTNEGDSWIVRDLDGGELIYTSERCTVLLLEKRKTA